MARLGFEFMLLEPCSNFSTKATYKSEATMTTEIKTSLVLPDAVAHNSTPLGASIGCWVAPRQETEHPAMCTALAMAKQ